MLSRVPLHTGNKWAIYSACVWLGLLAGWVLARAEGNSLWCIFNPG